MGYTFKPKQEHAKAYGDNLSISTKNSVKVCRAVNKKKLKTAKRLLEDLIAEKRSLKGKYYTNACSEILSILESCEKNAEFMGLEADKLFVHAGATHGMNRRRRRRKSGFGSGMKMTNIEIMLVQKGKEKTAKPGKKSDTGKPVSKSSDNVPKKKERKELIAPKEQSKISKNEKNKNREGSIMSEGGK